jgi:UDP-N-acetylglucosamine--N-acetylmuramyl-(pentapeptide) pyrophosphoryl-undecaprenol N-acetylglucosamine transferase
LAAATLAIPCAIHESNAVPGLTNRVLGRLVRRVYLGFAAARGAFPAARSVVTGNPVRREIAAVAAARAWPAGRPVHVLIVGGSQGSEFLNREVPALLAAVRDRGVALQVRHQVGKQDGAPVKATYAAAGIEADVETFIDDMAAAYAWADVAITRSGSGTVAELAAAALPALLVPFPFAAGDHQAANAAAFCRGGAGHWVRQGAWQLAPLAAWLAGLLASPEAWQAASDAARAVALPDAAVAVVRDSGATLGIAAWQEVQP